MKRRPGDYSWEKVSLLDDDWDDAGVGDVLNTSRGERRSAPRNSGEYRRSNRYIEDGYGELDFA
jgi:hypothetical protein